MVISNRYMQFRDKEQTNYNTNNKHNTPFNPVFVEINLLDALEVSSEEYF